MEKQIEGKNVILRRPVDGDAAFFARWYNKPEVMAECGFTERTTLEQELAAIHRCLESKDRDWYTITDKTGRVIGEAGLLRMFHEWRCTDLTIIIPDPNDQGKGYGTEAIELMFDIAFHHWEFNRISIGVVGFNTSALKFYEKVGFKKEGIQEQGYFYKGEFSDFIMMRILKSEYILRN
ncbi:MAG TPA: GNAT family protein [Clostridia bacterium]|nr:GNAT family protein [Clostridia bacterium]